MPTIPRVDLTGRRFGRITIIGFKDRTHSHSRWFCRCDCGTEFVSIGNNLVRGKSKSCGCLRREIMSEKFTTHGDSQARLFRIWSGMKTRIFNNQESRYKDYGGRGIKLCERWLKYENFKDDMYPSYLKHVQEFGEHQTTIERKDVDGDYCLENCTWATYSEQNKNTRRTAKLSFQGQLYTIRELAQKINMNQYTFKDRITRGWTVEKAVQTPVKH